MDEIGDVAVRHVVSLGGDARGRVREIRDGDFVFPCWECRRGSGAPTGHAAYVSHDPALQTPGYCQMSLRDKCEVSKDSSAIARDRFECERVAFNYSSGQMRDQPAIVGCRSGKRLVRTNVVWLLSFPQK